MKRRGATLIELVVVFSVFFAVLGAIWMIYGTTVRVERNVSLKVDLDREVFAAVRHVDAALKTSRLLQPSDWYHPQPVDTLELQPLLLGTDGQPQITGQGFPAYGNPYTITFANGELTRVTEEHRRLANLGEHGEVHFLRTSQGMLQMAIKVEKTGVRGETATRDLNFQLRLFNQ